LLEDTDSLCGVCGAAVKEENGNNPAGGESSADIAPSAGEAVWETGGGGGHDEALPPPKKKETIEFQWNIHEFPSNETRKTEEIAFNWRTELNAIEAAESRDEMAAPAPAGNMAENANGGAEWYGTGNQEDYSDTLSDWFGTDRDENIPDVWYTASGGSPEKFRRPGSADRVPPDAVRESGGKRNFQDLPYGTPPGTHKPDKELFFTFDQENEEFQQLLDEEYERVSTYDAQAPSMDGAPVFSPGPPPVRLVLPESGAEAGAFPTAGAAALSSLPEGATEAGTFSAGESAAVRLVLPESGAEAETFSGGGDAPVGSGQSIGAPVSGSEARMKEALDAMERERNEWENRKRVSAGVKVIIALAVIIILITAAAAGIKIFAADSIAALWIDFILSRVLDIASGRA
jgi:hypothetical protein